MLKNFLMKKMMQKQMKGVPQEEQDKLLAMVEKNPKLFEKIAQEVQEKVKGGKDQMQATMEVMQNHQEELQKLMTE